MNRIAGECVAEDSVLRRRPERTHDVARVDVFEGEVAARLDRALEDASNIASVGGESLVAGGITLGRARAEDATFGDHDDRVSAPVDALAEPGEEPIERERHLRYETRVHFV